MNTPLIYPDGEITDILGRWKAQFCDIGYPDELKDIEWINSHPSEEDIWIDFFTYDEGCFIPMCTFYGMVRPPWHIGKLLFVYRDES